MDAPAVEKRARFMKDLAEAHEWRFKLRAGDLVDTRSCDGQWYEAKVVSVEDDTVKVHPLTLSEAFDCTVNRLSSDIQPRHTFTTKWQETVDEGVIVEVRQAHDQWSERRVLSIRTERGSPSIEVYRHDTSGEKRWIELRGSDHVRPVPSCASASEAQETGRTAPRGGKASTIGQVLCQVHWERYRLGSRPLRPGGSRQISSTRNLSTSSTPSVAPKKVAIIGSSGGGAAALGQFDALSLLSLASSELEKAGMEVAAVQFVACGQPLDTAPMDADATLWVLNGDDGLSMSTRGTLQEVNERAMEEDARIAAALARNKQQTGTVSTPVGGGQLFLGLDGLVAISCDVQGVNRKTFTAAVAHQTPIVGTGGTSLGAAMAMGCRVISSSGGSVATTNKSKVASYASGLAHHWGHEYDAGKALNLPLAPAAIFGGCLPSFLGVLVVSEFFATCAVLDGLAHDWAVWSSLPVISAAVAARQVSSMKDIATAAGIMAGFSCKDSIVGALIVGTCAGNLCSRMAAGCLGLRCPATALSIITTITSSMCSRMVLVPLMPLIQLLEEALVSTDKLLHELPGVWTKAIVGAAMGCLMCYGSKVGWYHRVFLPVIVLEIARRHGSIWGTIDLCALCMVAAGLCVAHWLRPDSKADLSLAIRGAGMNLLFGDFIEAAYPFMERSIWCNAGAYLGSALSGAMVAAQATKSTAYIPLPLALFMSRDTFWLCMATGTAFFSAFLLAMVRPMPRGSLSK